VCLWRYCRGSLRHCDCAWFDFGRSRKSIGRASSACSRSIRAPFASRTCSPVTAQWLSFGSLPSRPILRSSRRSHWAFQNTLRGSRYNRFRLWAVLYLAAPFPSRATPVMDFFTMSASPGFGIFLITRFAVAISAFIVQVLLSRRRAPARGASPLLLNDVSDTCLNPRLSRLWRCMMASSSGSTMRHAFHQLHDR